MQDQSYFHTVACVVRQLIGCGAVLLALDCPEADIGHVLLQWLPGDDEARLYGAGELLSLFELERVRALRDIACQSGQARFLNERLQTVGGFATQGVMIAPLLSPSGTAGYFILADAFDDGFTPGDVRLLDTFLPALLPEFERHMRALCEFAPVPVDGRGDADSMKHDLISMVGHELRAPLTAIKGYTALLQAYSVQDRQREDKQNEPRTTITLARQQSYLDIIMEQARHLELMMNDLLDVSRIQAGKMALCYTEVNVSTLCQQVMRLARQRISQADRAQYILRCHVFPELPPLQIDAIRLQQILQNLLDNAIKYSPGGGVIELRASAEYENLIGSFPGQMPATRPVMQITICDQGIGISAQQRERLFQPFSRLDHAGTGSVQGVGLGLYITHRLVEALQGSIELISRENKGTQVILRFPLKQPGEALQPLSIEKRMLEQRA